ncbi:hypothetical protein BGZ60DRAFT_547214 [Tricladium varicosporioides]|nr:hypothetical protein BGZ60DRAFT_547214 [Hymenoscyphus varicosporioides]
MEATSLASLEASPHTAALPSCTELQTIAQPKPQALPLAQSIDGPILVQQSSISGFNKWKTWHALLFHCCGSSFVDIPAPTSALAQSPVPKCSICSCKCCDLVKGISTKHCSAWEAAQMQEAERRKRDNTWLRELEKIRTEQEQFIVGEKCRSVFSEDTDVGLGSKHREVSPRPIEDGKDKRSKQLSNLDLESLSTDGSDQGSMEGMKSPLKSPGPVSFTRKQKGKWKGQDGDATSEFSITSMRVVRTDAADYINNSDVDDFVYDGSHNKTDYSLPAPDSSLGQIAEEDDDIVQRQDEREIDEIFNRHA